MNNVLLASKNYKPQTIFYKKLEMEDGKVIEIFDNVLDADKFKVICDFHKRVTYKQEPDGVALRFYKQNECDNILNLFNENSVIKNLIHQLKYSHSWSVKITPNLNYKLTDGYGYHIDSQETSSKTLVFYAHENWEINWGGETIFMNDDLSYGYAIQCKPNRMIIFDSKIIHGFSKTKNTECDRYSFMWLFT